MVDGHLNIIAFFSFMLLDREKGTEPSITNVMAETQTVGTEMQKKC